MSRRSLHWKRLLGAPGWAKGKNPGPHKRHEAKDSQCGGSSDKLKRTLPSGKVKDKNGNVCTLPMKPETRERAIAAAEGRPPKLEQFK
ncbi:MAG: hypothetical protein GWN53_17415 [Gammaproteobacteria bacterium]|uniref:Uncharacterized protein n=1 Tax=Candidatus Kutchimonas denitrificans TaxID=3056748 RepID=A0AAE4ZAU9_9BACT|nr:hypothetical protein [Candidatus Kutchimonas denitrificans]NIV53621.1 hypothetical protein [Gammaproteobacteria bacterium]